MCFSGFYNARTFRPYVYRNAVRFLLDFTSFHVIISSICIDGSQLPCAHVFASVNIFSFHILLRLLYGIHHELLLSLHTFCCCCCCNISYCSIRNNSLVIRTIMNAHKKKFEQIQQFKCSIVSR